METDEGLDNEQIRKAINEAIEKLDKKSQIVKEKNEELEKESLPKISHIKNSFQFLADNVLKPAFANSGSTLELINSASIATSTVNDRDSNFVELLFYPKGISKEIRGVNTAALRFVFVAKEGMIKILKRNTYFPRPLVESGSIRIDDNSLNELSKTTVQFIEDLAETSH